MRPARFAPHAQTGEKKEVYYVHIPTTQDMNGAVKPERARPAKSKANEFYHPRETITEYIYNLANNKKMNESALFATKEECQEACDKINEELALVHVAKPLAKPLLKNKGIDTIPNA